MAKFKDCYDGPGEVLSVERVRGQDTGANRFGKKAAELPILRDYVMKTNPGADWLLALLAGETDRDWWDKAEKGPYVDILTKRHNHVARADLEADKFQWPDLLTYNGLFYFHQVGPTLFIGLVAGRHEFYEIKPDTKAQIKKGQKKLEHIEKMYRSKKYNLIYKRGSWYPHPDRNVAQIPIEIRIPLNSAFQYHINILLGRGHLRLVRLYLSVRRPEDGLLLYRLCIELEDDDRKRNRQKVLTKALAKHVYATYLASHYPQDFEQLAPELGDFSFEGDKLPRIRCNWNVVDELEPLKGELATAIYVRGIGLPGERYIVCCDEVMWQYLVRPMTVKDIWETIKSSVRKQLVSLGQGALWARVQHHILRAEDAADLAQTWLKQRSLVDLEGMANVVLAYVQKNPGAAVAIALAPLVICAGVAALLEVGMLAALVGGSEAGLSATTAGQVFGGLGRVALAEEILLGTRAGAGVPRLMSELGVRLAISGGTAANDVVLANAMAGTAMKTVVQRAAVAASFLLMTVHTQAYAMGAPAPGAGPSGAIPSNATLLAELASGMFIVQAREAPSMKPPPKGGIVNLRDLATLPDLPEEKKLDTTDLFQPRPAVWTRYLGTVSIS